MKTYKKHIIILFVVFIALLCLISFYFGFKSKDDITLGMFKITRVEDVDNNTTVFFEKCNNATHYLVTITDVDDNIIYQTDNTKNRVSIQSAHVEYNQTIFISVIAYNKNEEQLQSSNIYEYVWDKPSFDDYNNNTLVNKDTDFSIKILGDIYNSEYTLKVLYKNNPIFTKNIDNNYLLIPYETLKEYNGKLTAVIYDKNNNILHQMNFYNNPVLVGNVKITSPSNNQELFWDEVVLKYRGGENATTYQALIYRNNKLLKTINGQEKNKIVIPAKTFKENTEYKIELRAMYGDYEEIAKKDFINIKIGIKKRVSPVYTNYNPENIKPGTQIELLSRTNGATIKYTTDGSNPLKKGLTYTGPITITNKITLRAVAIKKSLENSDITTFDFNPSHKNIVVYLSPSNQYQNLGVKKVGYTNEMEMMNKVADKVSIKLKEAGITVYRNNPKDDMMIWLRESRNVKADLHLAIHSNGSTNHDTKGMEIYVNDSSSKMLSLATLMYTNLYSIYPYQNSNTDRGIKYADGHLGEVNPLNTSRGILIEIAHHDDYDDAKWMVDNLEQISNNIASTIISYYQVK